MRHGASCCTGQLFLAPSSQRQHLRRRCLLLVGVARGRCSRQRPQRRRGLVPLHDIRHVYRTSGAPALRFGCTCRVCTAAARAAIHACSAATRRVGQGRLQGTAAQSVERRRAACTVRTARSPAVHRARRAEAPRVCTTQAAGTCTCTGTGTAAVATRLLIATTHAARDSGSVQCRLEAPHQRIQVIPAGAWAVPTLAGHHLQATTHKRAAPRTLRG